MRKYLATAENEFRKFFRLKNILIFATLVIVLALITFPIFLNFHKSDPIFIDNEEYKLSSWQNTYEQRKKDWEQYPSAQSYHLMKEAEYRLQNKILNDELWGGVKTKGNYFKYSNLFFLGVIGLILIFGNLLITKEYTSKNLLVASTIPIKKRYIFLSKMLVMTVYSTVAVILFYSIVSLLSIFFSGYGGILQFSFGVGESIKYLSYADAVLTLACLSWFSCLLASAFVLMIGALAKSVYISLPFTAIITFFTYFFGSASMEEFDHMNGSTYFIANIVPFFDLDSTNSWITQSFKRVPNAPWLSILINIGWIILFLTIGAWIFEKRQVK